jgi:membrane-associated protease RseP (regulator of RpoE activity)
VVSTGVRRFGFILVVLGVVTACGQPETSPATSTTAPSGTSLNPANISKARGQLPAGYEVADVAGPASPVAFWGFGPGWVAEPAACGVLAGPVTDGATTRGWSGSGPGGIVHAVVIGSPTAPVTFDPAVLAECKQWTVMSGNTTGTVNLIEAPPIDGATTVGMATVAKTVVEGGTETTSSAGTFNAYLGDYLAFVTVVTDPGSPNPPLGQEFAADLLIKTVSALRG